MLLLGAALGACTEHLRNDLYEDRRETIAPLAGDALASNRVSQMIDPWSRASANRNIAYNGEKMQTASERYRTGRVIPPVNPTTSSSYSAQQAAQAAASTPASTPSSGATIK
jgi:hypothetical protein